jgi:hypothetical protein
LAGDLQELQRQLEEVDKKWPLKQIRKK